MKNAVIYFGNSLSPDQSLDLSHRRQALDRGLQLVRSVPGVEVTSELPMACAVFVRLSDGALKQMHSILEEEHAGTITIDEPSRPVFHAAR
jgi:hypothetical protein